MRDEIEVITDADEIRGYRLDLKKKQDEFFEARLRDVLGGIDPSWCVDDEHILGSDYAGVFQHRLGGLVTDFARIHHLQAIYELGLDPGVGFPDFRENGAVAYYQPTKMPVSLEPYLGSQIVFRSNALEKNLPRLGSFALKNSRYFAQVGNYWSVSRRSQDYERDDRRHHLFFSARVLMDPQT